LPIFGLILVVGRKDLDRGFNLEPISKCSAFFQRFRKFVERTFFLAKSPKVPTSDQKERKLDVDVEERGNPPSP
jgi:hypothetical protein